MSKAVDAFWDAHIEAIENAIAYRSDRDERAVVHGLFDPMATHVAVLFEDAVAAFQSSSFGTSVFLALTAIEETAKAEVAIFRRRPKNGSVSKGRDPLRDHRSKHRIAVRPTTFMGRLPALLGQERCNALRDEVMATGFAGLRERSLYVHVEPDGAKTPKDAVSHERAREILLLGLEVADDVLVGWTNHSFVLGKRFEQLIEKIS